MKISIVTAVFNRVGTVAEAMASVRRQTYTDVEHVIQDGGSTDGTLAIIECEATESTRVESAPDRGLYDALNKGIARATGDVIGFMHSDDFFAHGDVLSRVAELMQSSGAEGVYGDLQYISADDPTKVIRHWRSGSYDRKRLARGWMPPHPTVYLRREVYERLGSYDTSYRISSDYEAMLRYLARGQVKLAYLPEVLVKMRLGGISNGSAIQILHKSREDLRAIRHHGVGGIGTLAIKNFSKLSQFFGTN